jgi:RimJ/RimL family protein N-acetyltransferase
MLLSPVRQRDVPVLETARLRLRSHGHPDLPDCVAMWSDPLITRYTIGSPSTPQRTWTRLLAYVGHWALQGFGYWAVEDKTTGRYIGELGFADFKREMQPAIHGSPELGWALASHAHGKGYATEALQAAVAWGDVHFVPGRTVCIISPHNLASLRVAEKLGYRQFAETLMDGERELLFEREPLR